MAIPWRNEWKTTKCVDSNSDFVMSAVQCSLGETRGLGVRDHFCLGGAQHFLPEFLIFARKVEYV